MDFKNIIKFAVFATLIGVIAFVFSACNGNEKKSEQSVSTSESSANVKYESISQDKAKSLMDTQSDYIILDVRTQDEYNAGHIENAVLIPDYEISEKAQSILKDKNQLILVYCRSGRRSKNASEQLANLGYTNVKEFGGINTWKYQIVK